MSLRLSDLRARFESSPDVVKREFDVPVLVWGTEGRVHQEPWERTVSETVGTPRAGDPLVFKLVKGTHPANPFAMGVTVGRVSSNDIALPDDSVSRFHAFFLHDEKRGAWTLTDAESKNGTWVAEERLEKNRAVLLRDGVRLRLGNTRVEFLSPAALVDRLAKR